MMKNLLNLYFSEVEASALKISLEICFQREEATK